VFIESLTLENFQCFGPEPKKILLHHYLTAFIGPNGAGKTAACQALVRLFGITNAEREIRVDDFHVPASEVEAPASRTLRLEAILAFPELDKDNDSAKGTVPSFFHRMTAEKDGQLKCRILLESTWTQDATLEGSIETHYWVVGTLEESYESTECTPLPSSERSRIQVVYIPSARDGARQVTTFLRGRLWRAAQWSDALAKDVADASKSLDERFHTEPATQVIEKAVGQRWGELHGATTHATPRFSPIGSEVTDLVRAAELRFEPDHARPSRPARMLSDGQRSLLHMALTSSALDVEAQVSDGTLAASFTLDPSQIPILTVLAVEEPENSLTPFYLSRIVSQLLDVAASSRAQAIVASHSPGVLARIDPEWVRHFRLDAAADTALVRSITLPADTTEAGKFVREAVRAHPELYFAQFVILGEGDTEEIVIPRIAQAQGIALDPSFVAMVPLGGRHTNHFWRLLNDLNIPHATLVDLDYGRADAGAGRLRDACRRLTDLGVDVFDGLDGFCSVEDVSDSITRAQILLIIEHLKTFGVFFSFPLDLDMTMLMQHWAAYTTIEGTQRGPDETDATEAVFGIMPEDAKDYWLPAEQGKLNQRLTQFRWYRYLFSNRSKPATHLRAISRLTDEQLKNAPDSLQPLIDYTRTSLGL
jgi:putative ATP-dependent endonuclease of OLD family